MKKLNKKKDYGLVCGAGLAKFEQDGVLFDVNGDEINPDGTPAKKPVRGRPKAEGGKTSKVDDTDAQLAAQDIV